MNEKELVDQLHEYEAGYKSTLLQLRIFRLKSIMQVYDAIENPNAMENIHSIEFHVCGGNEWKFSYIHEYNGQKLPVTCHFRRDRYVINDEQKYEIYKGAGGKIRITARDKEYEYDLATQEEYIKTELNNIRLPEYMALRLVSALSYNDWDGADFYTYITRF